MATSSITMKRNDTKPVLDVILQDAVGTALNLGNDVDTVVFTMKEADSDTIKVMQRPCTIPTGGADGLVRYTWISADTNTAGTYLGEFTINYNDGSKLTVPTNSVLSIIILEDYDAD